MLRAVIRLVSAWYRCDAVRTSPMDGRLLQLRQGDEFVLLDELYTVNSTSLKRDANEQPKLLICDVRTPDLSGIFEVHVCDPTSGRLRFRGEEITVFPEDLQILTRR